MDFGIARAQRFDTLTATSAFLGTPHYVAPEMIEGPGAEPRSDLYALGVVLFELVTGQRPFDADTPFGILKKHCLEEPQAPSRLRPGAAARDRPRSCCSCCARTWPTGPRTPRRW